MAVYIKDEVLEGWAEGLGSQQDRIDALKFSQSQLGDEDRALLKREFSAALKNRYEFTREFTIRTERKILVPKGISAAPKPVRRAGRELHMGRAMLLVMKPDHVIERLGDLEEQRSTKIAPMYGQGFSVFWYWWTGLMIALVAILSKAETLASKLKKLWDTPTKG